MIITYGDDQRGYPHPDHLKVHDISLLAFERAGDPAWYPELGEPCQPQKLYYSVWAKARLTAIHEAMIELRGESPFDQDWLDRPGHDHRITTGSTSATSCGRAAVRCGPTPPRSTPTSRGGSA